MGRRGGKKVKLFVFMRSLDMLILYCRAIAAASASAVVNARITELTRESRGRISSTKSTTMTLQSSQRKN